MSKPEHAVADAIRDVAAEVANAIEAGDRSRQFDADDLVEVLLAIADRLDPMWAEPTLRFPAPDCHNSE